MAGRFTVKFQAGISAWSQTYKDTPAGHLEAARDKAAATLRGRGHDMMFWSKHRDTPPYYSARCAACGGGIKVATGRAPGNLPGYPSLLSRRRIGFCPGPSRRRRR